MSQPKQTYSLPNKHYGSEFFFGYVFFSLLNNQQKSKPSLLDGSKFSALF